LLDPDVLLRVDFGPEAPIPFRVLRGAEQVAAQASMYGRGPGATHLVLVNGAVGELRLRDGRLFAVLAFTVTGGRIVAMDILADPERLARLELPALG
jgi:RNA polymerase sigma-70 factor (ECF subfamily)